MKTKLISTLKKELLLVDLLENGYYEEYRDGIEVRDFLTDEVLTLTNYTLLGRPNEIKESDARALVEQSIHTGLFAHYVKDIPVNTYCYRNALESFNSALESEIYYENPFGKEETEIIDGLGSGTIDLAYENKQWQQAQEKTFDRNRTLIFVKN